MRLNTGVLLTRFNSIEKKPGFFILRHETWFLLTLINI